MIGQFEFVVFCGLCCTDLKKSPGKQRFVKIKLFILFAKTNNYLSDQGSMDLS
jgi:hypothetical protein